MKVFKVYRSKGVQGVQVFKVYRSEGVRCNGFNSGARVQLCTVTCSTGSMHLATISGAMMLLTLCTASCTPFPCLGERGFLI